MGVSGTSYLHNIDRLSDSYKPYPPPVCLWQNHPPMKKEKAVKEKTLQPPFIQASMMRISIFKGRPIP